MNIHDLDTFLTLADLLHFGKASRACNLSPSALTRSIQRLEDEIGHPLFVRDNRSVSLTPAGRRFQDYARQAKQEWQVLQQELQESPSVSGPLSIYASITAVYSLLPQLLESYRTAWPDVQIELRTGAAEQAVEQVLTGEMDLAVAALPDRRAPQLEFLSLTRIPLLFIAPRQGLLSEPPQKNDRLDLGRTPLVLPRSGLSRRRLDQWMKKQNIVPQIASEVSGNEALIAMVRLGCGIGIVPQLVLEKSPFRDEVQVLESAPQLDPYDVGLCATRRGLARPAVLAFWNLAEAK
ncbi:MAG: HTH-type transcriptional activator IlvY [Kiritimatiellales bacterium]